MELNKRFQSNGNLSLFMSTLYVKFSALHCTSIMHAPYVSRIYSIFLCSYALSPPFAVCLSHIVFLISWSCQQSGDRGVHHVRLASLSYYQEMCGRLQSPVKCQRGVLYNLSVQTLPQDTAAVFPAMPQTRRIRKRDHYLLPDSRIGSGCSGEGQLLTADMSD